MATKETILQRKVRFWVKEAQEKFLLHEWDIAISWDCEADGAAMAVSCMPEYRRASIKVNLDLCKDEDDETIRFYSYHEVIHVRLWEFVELLQNKKVSKKQKRNAEEALVEIMVKAFLRQAKPDSSR